MYISLDLDYPECKSKNFAPCYVRSCGLSWGGAMFLVSDTVCGGGKNACDMRLVFLLPIQLSQTLVL